MLDPAGDVAFYIKPDQLAFYLKSVKISPRVLGAFFLAASHQSSLL
jgi:hypothetical protein